MKCPECGQIMKREVRDHQYIESGLSNVILKNIPMYKCLCGNEMAEIPAIERLHQKIAEDLFRKPALLTGEEIRFLRKEMELKAVELAHLLGVSKVTVSRWENQAKSIGILSDRLIRLLYLNTSEKGGKEWRREDILKVIVSIKNRPQKIKIEVSQKDLVAA
jgi:putative transcriptional regulator